MNVRGFVRYPVREALTFRAFQRERAEQFREIRVESKRDAHAQFARVEHRQSAARTDDFRIFENGVEQSVAYFEPAEKPFTVALLLDTSASTHFHLAEIKGYKSGVVALCYEVRSK